VPAICSQVLTEDAPPLSSKRPGLPARLEAVVMRCLEKHREQRFANVKELRAALSAAGEHDVVPLGPTRVLPPKPAAMPATAPARAPAAVPAPALPPVRRPRWLVPTAAALWLIVLAFAIQVCGRSSAAPPIAKPQLTPPAVAPPTPIAEAHAEEGVVSIDALPLEKRSEATRHARADLSPPAALAPTPSPEAAVAKPRTPEDLLRDRK
jgi:serine/threonine-protein kinase